MEKAKRQEKKCLNDIRIMTRDLILALFIHLFIFQHAFVMVRHSLKASFFFVPFSYGLLLCIMSINKVNRICNL